MCGIIGVVNKNDKKINEAGLKGMADSLAHRGPDDEGFFIKDFVGLGHRRLSIIDISFRGHQPMTYGNSKKWIVYNGEVYNYIELRTELRKKGYEFKSDTDTEVILASFIEWGDEAFSKLNGMWALAIYDENEQSIILCRDRYGIKPLYYFDNNSFFAFASEYKAFLKYKELDIDLDYRGIITALENPFNLEGSGYTILKNVRNLLPGHILKINNERELKIEQWWNTAEHISELSISEDNAAEQFKDYFFDSCKIRMRADVNIGTSLSGGLDSSSIVSSLSHLGYNRNIAFIHGFKGYSIDETNYAMDVVNSALVPYEIVEAKQDDVLKNIDKILFSFESIYSGMPDAAFRIYQAQKARGVKVSLDGHGADEMLCGYPWHIDEAIKDTGIFNFNRFKILMNLKNEMTGNKQFKGNFFILKTLLKSSKLIDRIKPYIKSGLKLAGIFPSKSFTFPEFINGGYKFYTPALPASWSSLKRKLYTDFHFTTLPRILKNFDAVSMANGVEVRMPFMDYRLVNFAFSLPDELKINKGFTKYILRKAMKGILPDSIRLRVGKIGFNSPMNQWFNTLMRPWIEEILNNSMYDAPFIDKKKMADFYRNILKNKQDMYWNESILFWQYLNALKLMKLLKGGKYV